MHVTGLKLRVRNRKIIFLFLIQFFWAPKPYGKNYGLDNIYNFYAENFCLSKPVMLVAISLILLIKGLNPVYTGTPLTGSFRNSEELDKFYWT